MGFSVIITIIVFMILIYLLNSFNYVSVDLIIYTTVV